MHVEWNEMPAPPMAMGHVLTRAESQDATSAVVVRLTPSGVALFVAPCLTLDLVIQWSAEVMARATRVAAEGGVLTDLAEPVRCIDGVQHVAEELVPIRSMP